MFKYYAGSKAFWALIEEMNPYPLLTVEEVIASAKAVGIQAVSTTMEGLPVIYFRGNTLIPLNQDGLLPVCCEVNVDVEAQQVLFSPQLGEWACVDPRFSPQFSHTMSSTEISAKLGYQAQVLDLPERVFLWENPFDPKSPQLVLRPDLEAEKLTAIDLMARLDHLLSS